MVLHLREVARVSLHIEHGLRFCDMPLGKPLTLLPRGSLPGGQSSGSTVALRVQGRSGVYHCIVEQDSLQKLSALSAQVDAVDVFLPATIGLS